MRRIVAVLIAAVACLMGGAAGYVLHGQASAVSSAAVCRFDGGGQLAAGDAVRTSDGRVWRCTEDGMLMELSAAVKPLEPVSRLSRPSLPSWVRWKGAGPKASVEVCGHGPAITVWGGSGDTSAVVCRDGKADVS